MAGLSSTNPFRNVFNPRVINSFAIDIKNVWQDFDEKRFLDEILSKLDSLSFKDRSDLICNSLAKYLPQEFPKAVNILLSALKDELSNVGDIQTNWDNFIVWPQTAFVAKYGKNHFELSMQALYKMTKRLSAEGHLRDFIEVDFQKSMQILHQWCKDENHHVRRLVSEGTRTRLPLSARIKKFQDDPLPIIELLEKLKDDESLYVRRSVANSINDVTKDNPKIAIATLKEWNKSSDEKIKWVVRHASRSLIKQGNPEILQMFDCDINAKIEISKITIKPEKQKIGSDIEFSFQISSNSHETQKLVVDFAVYFKKANGKTRPKVFKLRNLNLSPKEEIKIAKKFSLKNTSGRKIYSGDHKIEVLVNGKACCQKKFLII